MLRETDRSDEIQRSQELLGNVHAEWGKSWSVWVPGLWLLAATLIAMVTGLSLANDFVHSVATGEVPPELRQPAIDVLGPTVSFAQIAVAAYAIHLVTPDYASGAIAPTFVAQPRRWLVVLAKAGIAVVVAVVLGALIGIVGNLAIATTLGDHLGTSLAPWAAALGTAAAFGQAAAVGVGIAFLTRSAVGSLSAAFLLLVVALAAPNALGRVLPGQAAATFFEDLGAQSWSWTGMSVMAVWSVGLVGAACWVVGRRDA